MHKNLLKSKTMARSNFVKTLAYKVRDEYNIKTVDGVFLDKFIDIEKKFFFFPRQKKANFFLFYEFWKME